MKFLCSAIACCFPFFTTAQGENALFQRHSIGGGINSLLQVDPREGHGPRYSPSQADFYMDYRYSFSRNDQLRIGFSSHLPRMDRWLLVYDKTLFFGYSRLLLQSNKLSLLGGLEIFYRQKSEEYDLGLNRILTVNYEEFAGGPGLSLSYALTHNCTLLTESYLTYGYTSRTDINYITEGIRLHRLFSLGLYYTW